MSSKMEMSLEDIITQTKGTRRGRGGGRGRGAGRGGRGGNRGGSPFKAGGGNRRGGNRMGGGGAPPFRRSRGGSAADGVWSHDKYQDFGGRKTAGGAQGGSAKITISNLHYGVSDADIMELFSEMGAIRYASVHYDRSGRSMGKADVTFERRADASQAIQQYNGVPLDGRAMAIGWASAPVATQQTSPRNLRQVQGGRVVRPGARGGFRGGRGARGGRGGGGGRGGQKKTAAPTAAELDAELDAYVSQKMV